MLDAIRQGKGPAHVHGLSSWLDFFLNLKPKYPLYYLFNLTWYMWGFCFLFKNKFEKAIEQLTVFHLSRGGQIINQFVVWIGNFCVLLTIDWFWWWSLVSSLSSVTGFISFYIVKRTSMFNTYSPRKNWIE